MEKALANNHAYRILAFIEKHAAYISALKDGALRRNWVISLIFALNACASLQRILSG